MANQDKKQAGREDLVQQNEGEGSRTAARHYNEATEKYVESGKVEPAAREAADALEGPEAEELREAEQEGKRRAADAPVQGKKGDAKPPEGPANAESRPTLKKAS